MVKLNIISGFLGAGKTTFVNLLLRHYMSKGLKPVYIVNELGQQVLDAEVIKANGFTAVEMEGGCVCCSLKEDIKTALDEVIDKFMPDVIVFEPSGVFVFDNFLDILKNESLAKKCEIGQVFTIVDSVNFVKTEAVYGSFIHNQIKNAQTLLISKLEKLETTNHDVNDIICDIRNINDEALVIAQKWSELDFDKLFTLIEDNPAKFANTVGHHHHVFRTYTGPVERDLTKADVDHIVQKHKEKYWGDIYRIKGILKVDGALTLLNIALEDVEHRPYKGYTEPSMTFIGNSVNEGAIKEFLSAG